MDISTMGKDELESLQVSKEDELRLAMDALNTVELRDIELSKKIVELQLDRKNLASSITQGKYNLRRIASELRAIKPLIFKRLRGE